MEWFFVFVGLMVILALIRISNGSKNSTGQTLGSNEPTHYWMHNDPGISNGEGAIASDSVDSGAGSFDGGSSDGGGGDSSGF